MYPQPQITVDGNVCGAEVLVRWEHPEKGLLNPGEFLPVFEKNYRIVDIDKCIWEPACKQIISPKAFECIDVYETLKSR
jgi:EAL domain-containing protein (putative c-di-GMP-specific phosphodiesterase class I)